MLASGARVEHRGRHNKKADQGLTDVAALRIVVNIITTLI